ncbi:hypothetical protein GCM10027569_91700 [Flindersiella endophytica]
MVTHLRQSRFRPDYLCCSRELGYDSKLYESDVQGGNQLCPRSHHSGSRRLSSGGRNRGSSRQAGSRRLSKGSSSAHRKARSRQVPRARPVPAAAPASRADPQRPRTAPDAVGSRWPPACPSSC